MRVRNDVVAGAGVVAEDHTDAARLLDHKPLLNSGVLSSESDDNLALHLGRIQGAGHAQRPARRHKESHSSERIKNWIAHAHRL
jgi:hypothetical protein